MKRYVVRFGAVALVSAALHGQAPQPRTFDAADVHVHPRGTTANPQMSGGVLRGGRYDLRNATMVDLITVAYGVDSSSVFGGPNWLELDRFDVLTKAPQATSQGALKDMLKALLADRFKLVTHTDSKPMPAFALVPGAGKHKMKEPADSAAPGGCDFLPPNVAPGGVQQNLVHCHNMTMESLAGFIRGAAAAYVPAPVVDLTTLKGGWDFDLKWTQRALLATAGSEGISIADAVDKQLGLKLEARTLPRTVLLVDSVNETPAPNAADIATVLPPKPPAEFDVASIKPYEPGTPFMSRLQPPIVDLQGLSLKNLLTIAWQINDDELIAAPKFADDLRFNISARVGAEAMGGRDPQNIQIDIDDVTLMLQSLLIDRFKIKAHTEDRPVTLWVLTAANPKLTKADPANRTSFKNGVPAVGARDPRDNNPIVSRLVTCQNMSMSQLASLLPRMAPGYVRTPVIDATGVEGSFDFSFSFTPNGVGGVAVGRGVSPGQAPAGASDPTGAISLPDALSKQLGLRLESQKRPYPVLVIDHIEEKPTED